MRKVNKDLLLKVSGIQCPHWTTIALWTIGIAVMTGLTIRNLKPIIKNFFNDDENTQVLIKPNRGDKEFKRPDLFLCIPLYSGDDFETLASLLWRNHTLSGLVQFGFDGLDEEWEQDYQGLIRNSFDVWNYWNQSAFIDVPNISDPDKNSPNRFPLKTIDPYTTESILRERLQQDFLDKLKEQTSNMSIIAKENFNWSRPVLTALTSVLTKRAKSETFFFFDYDTSPIEYELSMTDLELIHTMLLSLLCEFITITTSNSTPSGESCLETFRYSSFATESLLGDQLVFCLELPMSAPDFVLSIGDEYFRLYLGGVRKKFLVYKKNPSHLFSWDDDIYKPPAKDFEGAAKHETVSITYTVQSSVIENRDHKLKTCYKESSKSECDWNCRLERFESVCKCPLYLNRTRIAQNSSFGNLPRSSLCNVSKFDKCYDAYQKQVEVCYKTCMDQCNSTTYQWDVSAELSDGDGNSMDEGEWFMLSVQAREQLYLEFIMNVKDHNEDLISQVGGVFNFYLGLSGLSIVFFLIYMFDTWRRWRVINQQDIRSNGAAANVENADRRPSSNLWHWRWAQLASTAAQSAKESGIQTEVSVLRNRLDESEAMHKKDIDDLIKAIEGIQIQNHTTVRTIFQEQKELEERQNEKFESLSRKIDILTEVIATNMKRPRD